MAEMVKQETGGNVAQAEHTRDNPMFTPRFDIFERDDELILWGDLPGVTTENLHIDFEKNELTIRGCVAPRQEGAQYLLGEYGIGDFYRTFAIGEAIDTEKISAELKNGVLTLHLPKTEAVKPRKIAVKAG
ncbi:Hsp20/alpha crystallin family protein [Bythopirellula polymerisocia]|uniref:Spore protein SP21 n=1 Tax=Bythopirellula polymerisocia TaxID=2528003 RepID=A0A5C6CRT5_9BACT|nr:Hsp20/alpha crystallin family protein [Bythopirellula polymerisocia]TWU27633.1 Spore protein SP21 [Bythopirellula polymerisocia]